MEKFNIQVDLTHYSRNMSLLRFGYRQPEGTLKAVAPRSKPVKVVKPSTKMVHVTEHTDHHHDLNEPSPNLSGEQPDKLSNHKTTLFKPGAKTALLILLLGCVVVGALTYWNRYKAKVGHEDL